MPADVLEHHDRVVHHEARAHDESHHGQGVERVAAQVHDPEGADERNGQGRRGNEHRTAVPEEQVDHADHEDHREDERLFRLVERVPDVGRAVDGERELRAPGQHCVKRRHQVLDRLDRFEHIRPGLHI